MKTAFEKKIIDHLALLLMAERTAIMTGDATAAMTKQTEYKGFTDALKMSLSERFCESCIRAAFEEVDKPCLTD